MNNEIKIEFLNTEKLNSLIKDAYFSNNNLGRIEGKHYLELEESDIAQEYTDISDLDGATAKILNSDLIDGSMRFILNKLENKITMSPISIYCVKENDKYIFY